MKWTSDSSLPNGLSLSSAGLLHGTVKATKVVPGTYDLSLQVTQTSKHVHLEDVAFLSLQLVS